MSIFSKKTADQKAAEKAAKQQRKQIISAHNDAIRSHLSKMEELANSVTINTTAEALRDGETVITATTGEIKGKTACMACTDQRIVITYGIGAGVIELPYDDIDRVDTGRKFNGSWVAFHNGRQETMFDKSTAKDPKMVLIKDTVRDQQGRQENTGGAHVDLAKLAELHASGVLTDDEFSAAKAKALGI